jgi:DNA-directed RNA polymerase specialized sigma24 family protein
MSWRDSDRETARAAWAAFFIRHREYLYKCLSRYGHAAEDIAAETFRRVYENSEQFDRNWVADPNDADAMRKLVKAWLGKLARWAAQDWFRGRRASCRVAPPGFFAARADHSCPDPSNTERPVDTAVIRLVREAVEELTMREQDIVWATANWWSPDLDNSPLPPEVIADLCRQYATTTENIRKIRQRAFAKIRSRLAAAGFGGESAVR